MNKIEFTFNTRPIEAFEHTFKPEIDSVLEIQVICHGELVKCIFIVENVFHNQSIDRFHNYFNIWAASFGFLTDQPVWNLKLSSSTLPKNPNDLTNKHCLYLGPFDLSTHGNNKIPEDSLKKILSLASCNNEEDLSKIQQFAFANGQTETVSRFSFLYNILLSAPYINDSQKKADKFILEAFPTTSQTPRPNSGKLIMETVYTRLRNQLAHSREGISYKETRDEIKANIETFSKVVAYSIQTSLSINLP